MTGQTFCNDTQEAGKLLAVLPISAATLTGNAHWPQLSPHKANSIAEQSRPLQTLPQPYLGSDLPLPQVSLLREGQEYQAVIVLVCDHRDIRDVVDVDGELGHAADPQGLAGFEILYVHDRAGIRSGIDGQQRPGLVVESQ